MHAMMFSIDAFGLGGHRLNPQLNEKAILYFGKKSTSREAICRLIECKIELKNVEELSKILGQCSCLAEVDLSGNLLGDEGLKCLLEFLPRLQVFNSINFSNNRLSPNGVLHLIDALNSYKNIVEVDMSLCPKDKSQIKFAKKEEKTEIYSGIPENKTNGGLPRKISLKKCNFLMEHLAKLFALLEMCINLGEIKLKNNGISLSAVENLLKKLKSCPNKLIIRIEEPWLQAADVINLVSVGIQVNSNIVEIRVIKQEALIIIEDNNHINDGSAALTAISLDQCGLKAHHLYSLKEVLESCSVLLELELSHNDIGDKGTVLLSEILLGNPELRKLVLESSSITGSGIIQLTAALSQCSSIEEINLSRNEIDDKGAKELASILPQKTWLKKINLSNCSSLSADGVAKLSEALCSCSSLEEIDLGSLILDDTGVYFLSRGLLNMPFLQKLILSNNSITPDGGVQVAEALKNSSRVEELNLSRNRIGDIGAERLADYLPAMRKLRKLNLSQNNIGAAGGTKLAIALANCLHIEEIHLGMNCTGDESAVRLAEALPSLSHLKILSLQSNHISSVGGVKLAQALSACHQLQEISLSENRIGEDSILKLAEALPDVKLLQKLDLKLNGISNAASIHLAVSLGRCPSIEEVVLSWNDIGDEGAMKFAEVLSRIPSLQELDLESNKITILGANKLAESLLKCPNVKVIRLWKNQILKDAAQNLRCQDPRLNFSF
nr:PREDICTED: protein NLRC5-like [Latimeria chalumnae]|eukprot:XP_014344562.1 PREDICTED: protein NLRC5-like [Latimeria chalumnae]